MPPQLVLCSLVGALLVVVGLAAMNDAHVRADVTRALDDMHALGLALEAYNADNKLYPHPSIHAAQSGLSGAHTLPWLGFSTPRVGVQWFTLTSPVAYVARVPHDPFDNQGQPDHEAVFVPGDDARFCVGRYDYNSNQWSSWILSSNGPSGTPYPALDIGQDVSVGRVAAQDYWAGGSPPAGRGPEWFRAPNPGASYVYDPSNGLRSSGILPWIGPASLTPTPTPIPGDYNRDGRVDEEDLLLLIEAWQGGRGQGAARVEAWLDTDSPCQEVDLYLILSLADNAQGPLRAYRFAIAFDSGILRYVRANDLGLGVEPEFVLDAHQVVLFAENPQGGLRNGDMLRVHLRWRGTPGAQPLSITVHAQAPLLDIRQRPIAHVLQPTDLQRSCLGAGGGS